MVRQVEGDATPPELRDIAAGSFDAAWRAWATRHDAEIRARLARGDEDSIVNLWQFGTSFTSRPRVSERGVATLARGETPEDLLIGRLDDMVAAMAAPDAGERLRFAREVLRRHGIDVTQPAGQEAARVYLVEVRARGIADHERYRKTLEQAKRAARPDAERVFGTVYRDRGLSSDTSLTIDFALDRAFEQAVSGAHLRPDAVRRVAIVGPGLDFTDKREGYDFYPPQTIQPFAVIDSLQRLGVPATGLEVVTLDLSPRVNQHLAEARERALAGQPYTLQLPLAADWPGHQWQPDLVSYWNALGSRIGVAVDPIAPPSAEVRTRAVRIRPEIAATILPRDLNVVVERLDPAGKPFDLIIATNILVYYDTFEQRLALTNVAAMLAPGGLFLTNYRMSPLAPMEPAPVFVTEVQFDHKGDGDSIYAYRRR